MLLLTVVISIGLDLLYTNIYLQSTGRGKIETVINSKEQNYDVIILGTSRANNHFVSQMFEDKGLKTFNYGISASQLFESSLLLKLMIERKWIIKNVIVDADINLSMEHNSESISTKFFPYIENSGIIKKHFINQEGFEILYYLPFYRYIKYESKIGFREMFLTAIHKKAKVLGNLGYYPLEKHKGANMKTNIVNVKPFPHNRYYEEIKQICTDNNINLIAVMTPMCENTKGMEYFDKVQKLYPEIHNYENVVVEDKYFSSCGHMNNAGARLFTARIIKDFFSKN